MSASITRFRKRLQQRKGEAVATPKIDDIQISYGVADGKVVVSFNAPVALLAMTPTQAAAMREQIQMALDALTKGVGNVG